MERNVVIVPEEKTNDIKTELKKIKDISLEKLAKEK